MTWPSVCARAASQADREDASISTNARRARGLALKGPSVEMNPVDSRVSALMDSKAIRSRAAVARWSPLHLVVRLRIPARRARFAFQTANQVVPVGAEAFASVRVDGYVTRPLDSAVTLTSASSHQPRNLPVASEPFVRTCLEATTVPAHQATKATRSRAATCATASNAAARPRIKSSEVRVYWPTAPVDARRVPKEPNASQ